MSARLHAQVIRPSLNKKNSKTKKQNKKKTWPVFQPASQSVIPPLCPDAFKENEMRPSRSVSHYSRRRVPLTYAEHVALGRKFKQLEQLISEITQTIADHIQSPMATSFRKRADKATEIKSQVEDHMWNELRRQRIEPPQHWGLVYYGPDHPVMVQESQPEQHAQPHTSTSATASEHVSRSHGN